MTALPQAEKCLAHPCEACAPVCLWVASWAAVAAEWALLASAA